jgi:hypothetical protein
MKSLRARALAVLAMSGALMVFGAAAYATTVTFTVPAGYNPYSSLTWAPIEGFQFNPYWTSNVGADQRNAPYIPGNLGAITSTFGAFKFNSISLSGWPWDDYDVLGGNIIDVPLVFYDDQSHIVAMRSVAIDRGNEFQEFSENIAGVWSISIGSGAFSALAVRLGSITFNELPAVVPEPPSLPLLALGLLLAAVPTVRRSRRPLRTPSPHHSS